MMRALSIVSRDKGLADDVVWVVEKFKDAVKRVEFVACDVV